MEKINEKIGVLKVMKQVMDTLKQNLGHQFREMNITGPQGMLMGILAHDGVMKISDLSEKLCLSNSTVSGIVDRLEKQGLVERTRSIEDRRVVYVSVTPKFEENAKEHFIAIQKMLEEMMSKATTEETGKILEGLSTLKKVIDRQKQNN